MHLGGFSPAHAANLWIKIDQKLFRGFRQINRDKEAFGHARNVQCAHAAVIDQRLQRLASFFVVSPCRAIGQIR